MDINNLLSAIKDLKSPNKVVVVGIEGYGGSGKSTLSEELKKNLPNSEVIKIDSFIIKEKAQNAQAWEEVFDRKRLEKQVLKPASLGSEINYQRLEWEENILGENINLLHLDYLIIDGISSYHPDIEHYYSLKIWVDTPIDIAKERGRSRDENNENASLWDKWAQCDLAYQQKFHSEKRADIIISNS